MKLLILLLLVSCGGASNPRCSSTITRPPVGQSCAATIDAVEVIDDNYTAHGLIAVGGYTQIEWVNGPSFPSPTSGHPVAGHTMPTVYVDSNGIRLCATIIASRGEAIHETSLAHEQGHCALVLTALSGGEGDVTGDPRHEGVMFSEYVPEANTTLQAMGL